MTYNASTGLLSTLQYPVSIAGYQRRLQYAHQNGLLQQISDAVAGTQRWTANAANPRGQFTQETLGNGIVVNHSFDAVIGWVGSIQAGVGGGASVQYESYLFYLIGNVTQRQNNNADLTENFYYDNLYRLDHSALGGTTNLQMTYDVMGDITVRSDIDGGASWTYDSVRKHSVVQAGNPSHSYSYGSNGSAITRNGDTIGWSSYNYFTSINGDNKNIVLYYGANRRRYDALNGLSAVFGTLGTAVGP